LASILAVMRLSDNPVLRGASRSSTSWFFRSMPRYVLLAMLGSGIGYLYNTAPMSGCRSGSSSRGLARAVNRTSPSSRFSLERHLLEHRSGSASSALGLSEAAYMAEIARAGILSVDKGQDRGRPSALGMSSGQADAADRACPQAMRVIVPPTGNETIAMVKDTSLLIAVNGASPSSIYQAYLFGQRGFKIIPGFVAATLWYLIICSILMVGQSYLEKYFGRGFGAVPKKTKEKIMKIEADH
jgi:polar amino acid transport system permease protein